MRKTILVIGAVIGLAAGLAYVDTSKPQVTAPGYRQLHEVGWRF